MKKRSVLISAILLVVVTLLGLALRLYRLDAQSLWYDEGFSVYLARMDLKEITARTAADIQPPLYYYLLHGWIRLLGQDETALRALSLVFGVLSVPLMYALAWLLFRSRMAGLLAALLIALSPLHIWYSQEVRMYTLLTFLGLLSSALLLLIIERVLSPSAAAKGRGAGGEPLLWLAYTLTAVAALYTHYFAFFILAFQGVYLLLVWGAHGFRPPRLVVGGLVSGTAAVLAYAPWLPHIVTRYGADTSYWSGQLKLHEVMIDIALSYVGGESVAEATGIVLAAGYGLVLGLCLLALLHHAARRPSAGGRGETSEPSDRAGDLPLQLDSSPPGSPYPLALLLLYLLLPPALVLLLSYNAPKFNARYVMMSQPALLLIYSGGLALLWRRGKRVLGNLVRWALASLSLLLLLAVALYADYQAYTVPSFARADYRGVARYLQQHLGPDEAVILASGHMFPVFDLYAPDIERYLLPDSPTLDTTRTLDYSIARDLNRWLAGKAGVWLVLWQDEVVDPVGYLTTLLGEVGEEQPVRASFSQVRLRHYRLPAGAQFSEQPRIEHPTDLNFGDKLRLLGYSQTGLQQVTLFWQAVRQLTEDLRVSVVLRDVNNQVWGQTDGRPSAYLFPTNRWPPGQVVFGRFDLVPLPGTPPGDYGLEVGVYSEEDPVGLDVLDAAGAPQGKRAMLGAVALSVPAVGAEEIDVANEIQADLGGGIQLLGWDVSRAEAQPGDRVLLTLAWAVNAQPQGDYAVHLWILDAVGRTLDAGTFPPTNLWHPTSMWQPGQAWRGQSTFRLPIQAQPGSARMVLQLIDGGGQPIGPVVELGEIEVLPTTRSFTPPVPGVPRETDFDGKITLMGADLAPDPVAAGGTLRVTLYWQARADMDIPYIVFVHLLGPDGQVVAGQDAQPVGGARPTTSWVPGEFITDAHVVPIPAELEPGEYVVEVGLYDAGAYNLPRLPVLGDEGQVETDRVIFGPVQVK